MYASVEAAEAAEFTLWEDLYSYRFEVGLLWKLWKRYEA